MNHRPIEDSVLESLDKTIRKLVKGELSEALDDAEALLKQYPDRDESLFVLGIVALRLNDRGRAIECLERAHEINPNCREYVDALAVVHTLEGQLSDGLYYAKLSTTVASDLALKKLIPAELSDYFAALDNVKPSNHYVAALADFNRRTYFHAISHCERELRINEGNVPCHRLFARCLMAVGDHARAISVLRAADRLAPNSTETFLLLGEALYGVGQVEEAISCHQDALTRAEPGDIGAPAAIIHGTRFLGEKAASFRLHVLSELDRRLSTYPDYSKEEALDVPKGKIRIGFVSDGFHEGEFASYFEGLARHYDHSAFEIYCYQQSIRQDSVTTQLKHLVDSWRTIYDLDDEVVSTIMRGDGLDIVVDAIGCGDGQRLAVYVDRPAPVRIAWTGFPDGLGLSVFDAVLSDPVLADGDSNGSNQTVALLETGLFGLTPMRHFPDVNELPAAGNGYVTFGATADLRLISVETVALWSRILQSLPGSRILFGNVLGISDYTRTAITDLFGEFDLGERVAFRQSVDEERTDPEFFQQVDIFLDPVTVSSFRSVTDALWMGVPCVAMKGPDRWSRLAASALTAASQTRWIADDTDGYADLAVDLASDVQALGVTRSGLRDVISHTALFTPQAFARSLENAVRPLVKTWADVTSS